MSRYKPPEWPARAISLEEMTELTVLGYKNEAQFQDWVIRTAISYEWDKELIFHPKVSFGSQSGWPDLSMVKGGRMIFLELKGPGGKPTPAQEKWIAAMKAAGQQVDVYWPKDWRAIRDLLAGEEQSR